jgi:hypothetical protein
LPFEIIEKTGSARALPWTLSEELSGLPIPEEADDCVSTFLLWLISVWINLNTSISTIRLPRAVTARAE